MVYLLHSLRPISTEVGLNLINNEESNGRIEELGLVHFFLVLNHTMIGKKTSAWKSMTCISRYLWYIFIRRPWCCSSGAKISSDCNELYAGVTWPDCAKFCLLGYFLRALAKNFWPKIRPKIGLLFGRNFVGKITSFLFHKMLKY